MYSDLDHDSYQRLHAAARRAAPELRRQAISAFWHQVGQAALRAFHALRRPAAGQLPPQA